MELQIWSRKHDYSQSISFAPKPNFSDPRIYYLTDNALESLSINVFNYTWYIKLSLCVLPCTYTETSYLIGD